jgi:SAM-dependent methyltransferase
MTAAKQGRTIHDVEAFWNANPLFQGESDHEPGSAAWFREHEAVYIRDCFAGSAPDAIFMDGVGPGSKVLDVGCGPGFWVRYFLRQGVREVHACDLTQTAVALTRRSLELFGLEADVRVGNAEALPYPDATFDHVNCQGVIHHSPSPASAVREFHRVLRPGGTVCFSVYHKGFLLRHPLLLRAVAAILRPFVGLKGRGREDLLASGDAQEIVRMYDGAANPIGMAFTREEVLAMTKGLFRGAKVGYFFFPARAFPVRIPRALHRALHRWAGLMIIVHAVKPHPGEAPAT